MELGGRAGEIAAASLVGSPPKLQLAILLLILASPAFGGEASDWPAMARTALSLAKLMGDESNRTLKSQQEPNQDTKELASGMKRGSSASDDLSRASKRGRIDSSSKSNGGGITEHARDMLQGIERALLLADSGELVQILEQNCIAHATSSLVQLAATHAKSLAALEFQADAA